MLAETPDSELRCCKCESNGITRSYNGGAQNTSMPCGGANNEVYLRHVPHQRTTNWLSSESLNTGFMINPIYCLRSSQTCRSLYLRCVDEFPIIDEKMQPSTLAQPPSPPPSSSWDNYAAARRSIRSE
ncbi:hypothetical protein ACI65C_012249 [Semiaphis heraclei]